MGQDISATALETTAAAASRRVRVRLRVDWADAGFGSEGSWTDESAYVKTAAGNHEAVSAARSVAPVGRGVSDRVTVVCRNPECAAPDSGLRFSPSNTNGTLYAYIADGGVYMKRATFEIGFYDGATPEYLRQITGYIVDAQEDFERRTVTFTIRDRAADAALTQASTALYTEYTAKQYMQALAALLERDAVDVGDQQFDLGIAVTPYQWADDESLWDEMGIVAEAQMGRIWFDKDGDLHFDDASHFIKPSSDSFDDPTTSQATFTVASFSNLAPQVRYDLIYNHVLVEYQPRYVAQQQTIFSAGDILPVRPTATYSSGHLDFKAEFRYPVWSVTTPAADTDYVAVTAGGTDITSDISISKTDYASHSDLEITNNNADYTAYLTKLALRGYPLLTEATAKYETSDATSISAYGKRTMAIRSNPYVQTYRHAQAIGDFALARYKDPQRRVRLSGVPARPWLEVGDRVTVTETLTDIDEDYFIEAMGWTFDGKRYAMNLDLVRAGDMFPYSTYFILGTSAYGTTARLFW
jgi:hypothetical protein